MKKGFARALGFWFVLFGSLCAVTTLILSIVCEVDAELLTLSIVTIVINVLWVVFQRRPSSEWSELRFLDTDGRLLFIPRWAVTIPLAILHFTEAGRTAALGNEEGRLLVASLVCILISVLNTAEIFIICARRHQFDNVPPIPPTFSAKTKSRYRPMANYDSRIEFQASAQTPVSLQSNPSAETIQLVPDSWAPVYKKLGASSADTKAENESIIAPKRPPKVPKGKVSKVIEKKPVVAAPKGSVVPE